MLRTSRETLRRLELRGGDCVSSMLGAMSLAYGVSVDDLLTVEVAR